MEKVKLFRLGDPALNRGLPRWRHQLVVGEKLGEGAFREVHAARGFDRLVVKDALRDIGQNVNELDNWTELKDTEWGEWIAPLVAYTPDYKTLVQVRTLPCTKFPRGFKCPNFFTDLKPANWGWYGDRLVCHDYALLRFAYIALDHVKMRRPNG